MSWVSLHMKSPYNALRFVLARHICSFNYLCLFEFIFLYFFEFNGLFLLQAVPGVRTLCFICRRHDPVDSRFDEVRKAFKTLGVEISGFIFAWIFLPKRINRVCRFDGFL